MLLLYYDQLHPDDDLFQNREVPHLQRRAGEDQLRGIRHSLPWEDHERPFRQQVAGALGLNQQIDRDSNSAPTQLPKSKVNVNRRMRNRVIPTQSKGEEIVLM